MLPERRRKGTYPRFGALRRFLEKAEPEGPRVESRVESSQPNKQENGERKSILTRGCVMFRGHEPKENMVPGGAQRA